MIELLLIMFTDSVMVDTIKIDTKIDSMIIDSLRSQVNTIQVQQTNLITEIDSLTQKIKAKLRKTK